MEDTEKNISQEELVETSEPEQTEAQDIVQDEEVAQASEENSAERNFARLRESREQAERERDEYRRKLEELQQYYVSQYTGNYQAQQQPKKKEEPDEKYDPINPDDLVEGRHLSRYEKEIQKLKEKQQEQEAISYAQQSMYTLRSRYKDFDDVVSTKNVEKLKKTYPAIAKTLSSSQDIIAMGESAYEIIRKLGIHDGDSYDVHKGKAVQNIQKPRSVSSSPLSQANQYDDRRYTEDMLDRYRQEMEDAIKRR